MADYISVGEALKLGGLFKGDKREVLAFISNVDTAFEVINPENSDVLYKVVFTRISGEPRVAKTQRNLENWDNLRTFFKNTYTEKRTLEFHANGYLGLDRAKMKAIPSGIKTFKDLFLSLHRAS